MRFLIEVSSRVIILDHGEKIFEDEPARLMHDPEVIEVYLGKGAAEALLASHGQPPEGGEG
jgi:branched-chain amino acid transport system ATP-binding protein